MNFKEYLNEAKTPWPKEVKKKTATSAQISKGESYTVVNTLSKEVLYDRLQRTSAKEVVDFLDDKNIIFGSSSFIFDKYLSEWKK